MKRTRLRRPGRLGPAMVAGGILLGAAGAASAARLGPVAFEPPTFAIGDINGQQGWTKLGPYDVAIAPTAAFPDAAGYRFGTQALRVSNATTSGSFSDQTFTPKLATPAGESVANRRFDARFRIGTTSAAHQPGLRVTVSPDNGKGARMSFLAFEDRPDGVHVVFFDATNPGPLPTVSSFNATDLVTLSRRRAHTVRFSLHLKPGPANDDVRIFIDGKLRTAPVKCPDRGHGTGKGKRTGPGVCGPKHGRAVTGTTWEDYYRYDPEQTGEGNVVPVVSNLLFRVSGTPAPATVAGGFLIDGVTLWSSNAPRHRRDCHRDAWKTRTRADGTTFRNRGSCVKYARSNGRR